MACHAHTFDPQVRLVLVLCHHLWWVSTSATGKKRKKERFTCLFLISLHQHLMPKPPWLAAVQGNRTLAKSFVSSGLWAASSYVATTFSFRGHDKYVWKMLSTNTRISYMITTIIAWKLWSMIINSHTYIFHDVFHIAWNISDKILTQNDTFRLIFQGLLSEALLWVWTGWQNLASFRREQKRRWKFSSNAYFQFLRQMRRFCA